MLEGKSDLSVRNTDETKQEAHLVQMVTYKQAQKHKEAQYVSLQIRMNTSPLDCYYINLKLLNDSFRTTTEDNTDTSTSLKGCKSVNANLRNLLGCILRQIQYQQLLTENQIPQETSSDPSDKPFHTVLLVKD